jgi:hypothetical protein
VAVDGPKYPLLGDFRGGQPRIEGGDGTPAGATVWNGYLVAVTVLVGLRMSKAYNNASPDVLDIPYVETHQFGSA